MYRTRSTDYVRAEAGEEPRAARHDEAVPNVDDEESERADTGELDGLGQAGTSEPQPGVGQHQGGGIDGAVGGGQSGQGGG